jgi:hypothetical protein
MHCECSCSLGKRSFCLISGFSLDMSAHVQSVHFVKTCFTEILE